MMSKEKKILKGIKFEYLKKGEKIDPKSIFSGYYEHVDISDDKWLDFYYTLTEKQKTLLSNLWK